jgi:hypothetical protein
MMDGSGAGSRAGYGVGSVLVTNGYIRTYVDPGGPKHTDPKNRDPDADSDPQPCLQLTTLV